MNKTFTYFFGFFMTSISLFADYTMYVPTKPGSGLDTWGQVIIKELEKYLDEPITTQHIPGARHVVGMNKWQSEIRFDKKAIAVTGGTTAVNTLVVEGVEYDFTTWDAIGVQLLDIFVGKSKFWDPQSEEKMIFGNESAAGDITGMILMVCGPLDGKLSSYETCIQEKVTLVKGVSDQDATLMFMRGEFNIFRGNPTAWTKKLANIENGELWFTQGVYDPKLQKSVSNKFAPNKDFDTVYKQTWGVEPAGELYDIYRLAQTQNDALQKGFWVNKNNPNRDKIVAALNKMLSDPESRQVIAQASGGDYDWAVGENADQIVLDLKSQYTEQKLKNLVYWFNNVLGYKAEYKPQLLD